LAPITFDDMMIGPRFLLQWLLLLCVSTTWGYSFVVPRTFDRALVPTSTRGDMRHNSRCTSIYSTAATESSNDVLRRWGVPLVPDNVQSHTMPPKPLNEIPALDEHNIPDVLCCHIKPRAEAFLISFHSKNCGPCILLSAKLNSLVAEFGELNVRIRQMDVGSADSLGLLPQAMTARGWSLQALPCLALFHQGLPIARLEAPSSVVEVKEFVHSHSYHWLNMESSAKKEDEDHDQSQSD